MNKILLMMLLSLGTQAQIKDTTILDKLKQELAITLNNLNKLL